MIKKCKACKQTYSVEMFPVRGVYADGSPAYRTLCKECYSHYRSFRRSEHFRWMKQIKCITQITHNSIEELDELSYDTCKYLMDLSDEEYFNDLKSRAKDYLESIGEQIDDTVELTDQTNVLVVGDTYGCHTSNKVISLLNNICKKYNVDYIIQTGTHLDEYGNHTRGFDKLTPKVIYITSQKERECLNEVSKRYNLHLCKSSVKFGNTTIYTQEIISPYSKTPISKLDPLIYRGDVVTNCSRQEYNVRNAGISTSYIVSTGCLADPFIPSDQMNKYMCVSQRQQLNSQLWNQGCILLTKHESSVIPIIFPIYKSENTYITAFDGHVFTDSEYTYTEDRTVIQSDIHAPKYDVDVMCSLLQFLRQNPPANVILNGDIVDMEPFNHHVLDKGHIPTVNVSQTFFGLSEVLGSIRASVGDDVPMQLVLGNHSNFLNRWLQTHTQLSSFFSDIFSSIIKSYDVDIIGFNDYTVAGNDVKVLHGNTDVGVSGSSMVEKVARTFDKAVIGHFHSTNMRFGCLSTGCLCKFDQGYNSPYTKWDHSFCVVTTYKDIDFISPVFFTNSNVICTGLSVYNSQDGCFITFKELSVSFSRGDFNG